MNPPTGTLLDQEPIAKQIIECMGRHTIKWIPNDLLLYRKINASLNPFIEVSICSR